MNIERVSSLIRELLLEIGEDPEREGLLKTPERYAKALQFLTRGYYQDLDTIINNAIFQAESNNMIIMRDIELYSLCEHHMLPFFGYAHVGYIAQKKVIGLSKIARIVDYYARRLQIQERLTAQIARAIMDHTQAEGVGVVLECRHLCTMMRGVEKQNSIMTTSSVLGSFHDDAITRQEFLQLLDKSTHK
ncbi:MAG: GTP cyclohydrolase I FolE [Candidatus Hydrogenedentes bacterium]|nr:GTP cyclohydrolase I FolE [Candidatus Hydrogenedentota bacterium]